MVMGMVTLQLRGFKREQVFSIRDRPLDTWKGLKALWDEGTTRRKELGSLNHHLEESHRPIRNTHSGPCHISERQATAECRHWHVRVS